MNTLRRRRLGTINYDPSAMAYFIAANITNTRERNAADTFIKTLKASGIWDQCDRIYLRSPTSLAASLMCCKSLTSQVAVNSPTFGPRGLAFNGTSSFARSDINVNQMAHVSLTSAHIFVLWDNLIGTSSGIAFAGTVEASKNCYFLQSDVMA